MPIITAPIVIAAVVIAIGAGASASKKRRRKQERRAIEPIQPSGPPVGSIVLTEVEYVIPDAWWDTHGTPSLQRIVESLEASGTPFDPVSVAWELVGSQGLPKPPAPRPPSGEMWQTDVPGAADYWDGPSTALGLFYHLVPFVDAALLSWTQGGALELLVEVTPEQPVETRVIDLTPQMINDSSIYKALVAMDVPGGRGGAIVFVYCSDHPHLPELMAAYEDAAADPVHTHIDFYRSDAANDDSGEAAPICQGGNVGALVAFSIDLGRWAEVRMNMAANLDLPSGLTVATPTVPTGADPLVMADAQTGIENIGNAIAFARGEITLPGTVEVPGVDMMETLGLAEGFEEL